MRSSLYKFPVFQYKDLVGIHYGTQTVSNHNDGFPLDQSGDSPLDQHLIFRIKGCGRLVQQNNRGVFQKSAGNRNTLALSARKGASIFTENGLVSIRKPHYKFVTVGNGVNVVFNALLIYGLGPFPQLGVFGAGLGTAIGAGATLVYTLALFLRRRHPATLRGRGAWLPEREYLCSLAPLATGTFLEQAAERFGMFTFSRLVADLGTAALSVHNICGSLCDIYYSFSQGLGKASLVQAGQALGSGRTCNLKRIGAVSRRAALWTGGAATLLYLLLRSPLLQFYHLEGNDLALGCEIMIFVAAVNIPEAWAMVHAGLLRGLGHTSFVALYSLISIAVVRPILTFFLVYELGLGLYGAWIALTLDQTTRAVCSMLGSRQTIRIKMKDSSNS